MIHLQTDFADHRVARIAREPDGVGEIRQFGLTREEEADLVAFLRTLTGPGPAAHLLTTPPLP